MIEILLFIIMLYISISCIFFVYFVFNKIKITCIMENIKITLEGFRELQEDIETVLNMLKEKDAEIEQKNEVLNRVYDFIWENDCCRYFSKKHALYNQVLNFDSCLGNCKRNCIKQYFERKVEDD